MEEEIEKLKKKLKKLKKRKKIFSIMYDLYIVRYRRVRRPSVITPMFITEGIMPIINTVVEEYEEITRYFPIHRENAVNYCIKIGLRGISDSLIRHKVLDSIQYSAFKRSYEMIFQETDIKEDIAIAKGECLHKNFDTVSYLENDNYPIRVIHHCKDCGDTFEL